MLVPVRALADLDTGDAVRLGRGPGTPPGPHPPVVVIDGIIHVESDEAGEVAA